eukprot:16446848-Heterocapsa_arctica.AAC.1
MEEPGHGCSKFAASNLASAGPTFMDHLALYQTAGRAIRLQAQDHLQQRKLELDRFFDKEPKVDVVR